MDGVYAKGGLGRFDTLPGDIQLLIWDMVQDDYNKAAMVIQYFFKDQKDKRRIRELWADELFSLDLRRAYNIAQRQIGKRNRQRLDTELAYRRTWYYKLIGQFADLFTGRRVSGEYYMDIENDELVDTFLG